MWVCVCVCGCGVCGCVWVGWVVNSQNVGIMLLINVEILSLILFAYCDCHYCIGTTSLVPRPLFLQFNARSNGVCVCVCGGIDWCVWGGGY